MNRRGKNLNRRTFIKQTTLLSTAVMVPTIVPASVFGAEAPSNRITIGCIGTGRMGQGDMKDLLRFGDIQIISVCDVDSKRAKDAQKLVNDHYSKLLGEAWNGCGAHGDFRDLIGRQDIDAVTVCTPDHWHALPAIAAAKAGKDIFIQKPLTLTIKEGRALSDAVKRYGRILQVGSQQRSDEKFRFACELVRNGRIGKLQTVKVGFGTDPGCDPQPEMSVPSNLDYNMWLGQAPLAPYTEMRVHPQKDYGRPGWLRISAYGHGMITGWGAHHLDIAQWGMNTELIGPTEIQGEAVFPKEGLWDVHGDFRIEYTYANGVKVVAMDNKRNKQGVVFEGSDGWVYVRRGFIDANPKSLLKEKIGPNEEQLYRSSDHKRNWIECMKSREETIAPVEIGHRSCTVCLLGSIATKLGRKLKWDPDKEEFIDDTVANHMRTRSMRAPWKL
ncbi:MAG: Gfo/Idh/MocA family oxidoreductase [Sedimentisphaerales bacterium]|nr:Gfo/Idh/MocA family oxidoreductase [Sedimentisphaerales bacterium]